MGLQGDSNVFVQGASSGIGCAFIEMLLKNHEVGHIYAACRSPESTATLQAIAGENEQLTLLPVDITDEDSIASAKNIIEQNTAHLDLVLNFTGVLHNDRGMFPERRLAEVTAENLKQSFQINAVGSLLLAKHLEPLLGRQRMSVFGALSARVGSITDNRLGGWYAYRSSKAALNMMLKNLSIEFTRNRRKIICIAIHPGTVDTRLSAPFQSNVPENKLFTPQLSAQYLLDVIASLEPADTGRFIAWNGEDIPW